MTKPKLWDLFKDPTDPKKFLRILFGDPDFLFQAGIFALCVFLSLDTRTYLPETRTFPQLLLYFIMVLSGICLLFKAFLPHLLPYIVAPREEGDEETDLAKTLTARRFYLGCLGIGLATAALILLGFIFMVPVYYAFYAFFLGERKNFLKVTVAALISMTVIYLIFGYMLALPMTRGLFFG